MQSRSCAEYVRSKKIILITRDRSCARILQIIYYLCKSCECIQYNKHDVTYIYKFCLHLFKPNKYV